MVTLDLNRKLHVYGCSFSDGGGLDAREYLTAALKRNLIPKTWEEKIKTFLFSSNDAYCIDFKEYHRYSSIIGRSLNIEVSNYSLTANNNEHIFNTAYNKLLEFPNDIHIIQWSLPQRKLYWSEIDNCFFRLQGVSKGKAFVFNVGDEDIPEDSSSGRFDSISQHFLDSLVYYQNLEYEDYKLNQTTTLLTSLAKINSTPLYFLPWIAPTGTTSNTVLVDEERDLSNWSLDTNNQIVHETEGEYDDCHLSLKANYIVAEKLIQRFKDDGLLTEK